MNQSSRPPRPLCVTLECAVYTLATGLVIIMLWKVWDLNFVWCSFIFLYHVWFIRAYWRGEYWVWKHLSNRCLLLDSEKKFYTEEMVAFFNVPRFEVNDFHRKHPA